MTDYNALHCEAAAYASANSDPWRPCRKGTFIPVSGRLGAA